MYRRALLIANAVYDDTAIPNLNGPKNDVDLFAKVLARDEVGPYLIVRVINRPFVETAAAIQKFFDEADRDDLLLLYVSGHGIRDELGWLYFPTIDSRLAQITATALRSTFLIDCIQKSAANQHILILDTCFSGAFVKGVTWKNTPAPVSQNDFVAVGSGTAVITASNGLQPALELAAKRGGEKARSAFTSCLIEGISSGQADRYRRGEIALNDAFEYARAALKRTGSGQTPRLWLFDVEGELVIAQNPVPQRAALPPGIRTSLSGGPLERLGTIDELTSLAASNTGPSGRAAKHALKRLASKDDSFAVRQVAIRALKLLKKGEPYFVTAVVIKWRTSILLRFRRLKVWIARTGSVLLELVKGLRNRMRPLPGTEARASIERRRIAFRWFTLLGPLIPPIALFIAVEISMASLPGFDSLKSSPNGQMIQVHAVDGTVLASLGPSYGQWLRSDQIPQVMKDAVVSIEDRRFFNHFGVDPVGVARSFWVSVAGRAYSHRTGGSSTITEQFARNVFLTNHHSIAVKIREAVISMALERNLSKDQILELYLNKIYLGKGCYGVDAAARKFFGHGADHLSLLEAAIIAGLVKSPNTYAPTTDAEASIDRARVVLQAMVQTGKISKVEATAADFSDVKLAPEPQQNREGYFIDWALPQLSELVDDQTDPLDVWTTLNPGMQRLADRAIRINTPGDAQGALVSMERDGAVRALVGGKDYIASNYNRAVTAQRQPGTAWQLFVYLAAIEAGHKPDEPIFDAPITIDGWNPQNEAGHYFGQISIRTAFALSLNSVAAKLGQLGGFDSVADMARRFGISTKINSYPAMVLGTADVHLIDMTRAFAEVDNKGAAVVPYGITKVVGPGGHTIYERTANDPRIIVSPSVAGAMTSLLHTAANTGAAREIRIGRPVAGKTGITTSKRNAWFFGFSSGLTTGVWMGRDDDKPDGRFADAKPPTTAWADFMKSALAARPIESIDKNVPSAPQ